MSADYKKTMVPDTINQMRDDKGESKKIEVPDGVDAELLMKVLANPEMAALFNSLAKTMKV